MRTISFRRPSSAVVRASALALLVLACESPTEPAVTIAEDADTERVRVMVPEAYELANVVLALTSFGTNDPDVVRQEGDYYEEVRARFDGMRSHASMAELQLATNDPLLQYFQFRENSAAYGFAEDRLVRGQRYAVIWQPNLFGNRLPAVQAFAEASAFRDFYQEQRPYYASLVARYRETARVEDMIAWLEREFVDELDRYNVFISPLVNGSHSANPQVTSIGREALMFVAGPDVDGGTSLSLPERQAIVQRILFTELDNLFVNPTSDGYASEIGTALRVRADWTTDPSPLYDTALTVFNEYMTWALFTLWLDEEAPPEAFEAIVSRMEDQMVGPRRFQRFREFNRALLALWREKAEGDRVLDLYPDILSWAEQR